MSIAISPFVSKFRLPQNGKTDSEFPNRCGNNAPLLLDIIGQYGPLLGTSVFNKSDESRYASTLLLDTYLLLLTYKSKHMYPVACLSTKQLDAAVSIEMLTLGLSTEGMCICAAFTCFTGFLTFGLRLVLAQEDNQRELQCCFQERPVRLSVCLTYL